MNIKHKEIRKAAEEIVDSYWDSKETKCDKCDATNCIHNETCIKCNQLLIPNANNETNTK